MTLAWTFTGKPVGGEAFPFLFFSIKNVLNERFFFLFVNRNVPASWKWTIIELRTFLMMVPIWTKLGFYGQAGK